jgi:DNA-binding NarL/FixJ family response regulator
MSQTDKRQMDTGYTISLSAMIGEARAALSDGSSSAEDRIARAQATLEKLLHRREAAAQPCLSPRQRDILQLIGRGLSNKSIARELNIAPETVKCHTRTILLKLKAQTRAQAVARAATISVW